MELKNMFKAEKGLIRVKLDVDDDNTINEADITGDFFIIPEEDIKNLQDCLKGSKFSEDDISNHLDEFYKSGAITPLVSKDDFLKAIMGAKHVQD